MVHLFLEPPLPTGQKPPVLLTPFKEQPAHKLTPRYLPFYKTRQSSSSLPKKTILNSTMFKTGSIDC